jgi:tetratricopeptide (TPR) repeat protein
MDRARTAVLGFLAIVHALCGCEAVAQESAASGARLELAQITTSEQTALAGLLAGARALSTQGRAQEAYQLLADAEDAYIGEIEFDYALGRAALAAGRPDRATLAFSRVLALDPSHGGALIDTGRAYLALGNFVQARAAFEALLGLDPPPPVRAQLQAYLAQTLRTETGEPGGLSLRGYVAATLGKSTNVNQSPSQGQVFVPAFGATFDLSQQNVRIADRYWAIAGGMDFSAPVNRTISLIGGADLIERENFRESDFDLSGVGARLGVAVGGETRSLRVQGFAGRSFVGHEANRDVAGLSVDYVQALSSDTQILAQGQAGSFRYPPASLQVFDANFAYAGLGASHQFDQNSTIFVGFSTGEEKDVGGNPNGDRHQIGLRASVEIGLWLRTKLIASAAPLRADYNKVDPSFLVERRDYRNEFEVMLQYAMDDRTVFRAGVTYADQRSSIPIYEFRRTEYWIMLRREFR